MDIRIANANDVDRLYQLLYQVQALHADGRPDVFKCGATKYSKEDILKILVCADSPIFVAVDKNGLTLGYAFCEFKYQKETSNLKERKILYLDDLCVDQEYRGKGIGGKLYDFVLRFAKAQKCDSLELNVWHLNQTAVRFYQKLGMSPLKTTMEQKLK